MAMTRRKFLVGGPVTATALFTVGLPVAHGAAGATSVARKIAHMAEASGVLFGPHHRKSGAGMMASLHMQCAAANSGYLEYMYDPGFWNPEGFQAGFAQPYPIDKQGYVHAPASPGLGIDWDRDFLRKHKLETA